MCQPRYPASSHAPSKFWERAALALVCGVLMALALSLVTGCNGKAVSGYVSRKVITDPDTRVVIYDRTVNTHATQELPPNAAGPTTQSVGESGTSQELAGTHATTPEQIVAQNQKALLYFAGGFALLAVVAFAIPGFRSFGIPAAIAAAAFGLTPWFMDTVGWWLLPLAAVAFLGWLVWFISQRWASIRSSKFAGETLAKADAAAGKGDKDQAVDLMRSAMAAMTVNKPEFAKAAGKVSRK